MRIIRLKEVMTMTGLSRSTLYNLLAEEKFPKSVSLGDRARGFVLSEVEDWIRERIAERDVCPLANHRT